MRGDHRSSSGIRFRTDLVIAVAMLVAAILVGVLLHASTRSSREGLAGRFDTRAELAASFTAEYLQQVADREAQIAQNRLGGELDPALLQQIAVDHGFVASLVLDEDGRLLEGYPRAPDLVNTDLGKKYAHLRGATGGTVSISNVVPSAAKGEPIVAVATPFQSPNGRRVFSSGFHVANTPLDAFIRNIHLPGGTAYLVDGAGRIITTSGSSPGAAGSLLLDQDPDMARTLRRRRGEFEQRGEATHFASVRVDGTSWRVITTVPTATLQRPLRPVALLQGALLLLLAVLACAVTWLVRRLAQAERRLGTQVLELGNRETRLNFMLDEVDRARDDERHRIAVEIHDSSLQQMIAARMMLDHVPMFEGDEQVAILARTGKILDDAVSATRDGLQGYSPLHTAHKPLDQALASCARDLQDTYMTTIVMDVDAPVTVDEEHHLVIMRMMGEAAVNACRHANASTLRISGCVETATLHLTIADDGCGFEYDPSRSLGGGTIGMGLPLMHERIRALGGDMHIISAPGSGTTVRLLIPLTSMDGLRSPAGMAQVARRR